MCIRDRDYIATEDLRIAVNASISLERPLLVKGEPGTGKTVLAEEIARALDMPILTWHIKSTTKAQQGLYEYDAITRLRDSQLGDEKVKDVKNYIKKGKLWEAFESEKRPILLIDEIDKADIEFPNDLLQELDRMEFYVYETGETIAAEKRPVVIITSNNEKELPDAFLRRCFFHFINFLKRSTFYLFDKKKPFYTIVFNILFHSFKIYMCLNTPFITNNGTPRTFSGKISKSGNSARNPRPTIINDDN